MSVIVFCSDKPTKCALSHSALADCKPMSEVLRWAPKRGCRRAGVPRVLRCPRAASCCTYIVTVAAAVKPGSQGGAPATRLWAPTPGPPSHTAPPWQPHCGPAPAARQSVADMAGNTSARCGSLTLMSQLSQHRRQQRRLALSTSPATAGHDASSMIDGGAHLGGRWQAAAPLLQLCSNPQATQQRRLPRLRAALAQQLLRLDLQQTSSCQYRW